MAPETVSFFALSDIEARGGDNQAHPVSRRLLARERWRLRSRMRHRSRIDLLHLRIEVRAELGTGPWERICLPVAVGTWIAVRLRSSHAGGGGVQSVWVGGAMAAAPCHSESRRATGRRRRGTRWRVSYRKLIHEASGGPA
jgi:hypothetical protein